MKCDFGFQSASLRGFPRPLQILMNYTAFLNIYKEKLDNCLVQPQIGLLFRGGIAAPPESRAVSKEIRIWHVIYCLGCRMGVQNYVLFRKKSGFGT